MIGTILKACVVIIVVVTIAGLAGVFIMAGVAGVHDVVPIPVPSHLYIGNFQGDYIDAYRAPLLNHTYHDIEQVAGEAFSLGGVEIYRDDQEIVFEGYRGGIRYYISYFLDKTTGPNTLTMVTLIRVHGNKGPWLWRLTKPVHKCLAPYLLDRMAQAAPD
jgi:hypothetical protein